MQVESRPWSWRMARIASTSRSSAAGSSAWPRRTGCSRRGPACSSRSSRRSRSSPAHQTGHNSGVVHAGLYYAPGLAQGAPLPRGQGRGRGVLRGARHPGRAGAASWWSPLDATRSCRASARPARAGAWPTASPGLEEVGPERIREIEPHAAGIRALWSPTTGDRRLPACRARACADEVRARGGAIETGRAVTGIERAAGRAGAPDAARRARARGALIACAGLWADRVAAHDRRRRADAPRIVPFRGDYYTLTPDARRLVRGLVYPVPDPRFPFLGVHFTRRIDGEVWAGPERGARLRARGLPTARPLAARPGRHARLPGLPAARRARSCGPGAAEMWRDLSKGAFLRGAAALRARAPRATSSAFGPSGRPRPGARPRRHARRRLRPRRRGRVLHVRNAPSPAATASLAIGRVLRDRALEQFAL